MRELHPTARRGLLISWGDQSAVAPIVEAAALGQIDFYLPKPVWSPDEQFHQTITESLAESATAPRSRAAAAMDAWSSSNSGTGTLTVPRQCRATDCSS